MHRFEFTSDVNYLTYFIAYITFSFLDVQNSNSKPRAPSLFQSLYHISSFETQCRSLFRTLFPINTESESSVSSCPSLYEGESPTFWASAAYYFADNYLRNYEENTTLWKAPAKKTLIFRPLTAKEWVTNILIFFYRLSHLNSNST